MKNENLIQLAEEYCKHFHKTQKRKGGNQEPYSTHPFAVRDILVKYGYDDAECQAIALLHDTIEDTTLGDNKSEIEKRFGTVIYQGVYILSNNTVGKYAEQLVPIFKDFKIPYLDEDGKLTPHAYKLRILFARDRIKSIKIADMIHNTKALPDLSKNSIRKKLRDALTFYIPLGNTIAPLMVKELISNVRNYKNSQHYKDTFG